MKSVCEFFLQDNRRKSRKIARRVPRAQRRRTDPRHQDAKLRIERSLIPTAQEPAAAGSHSARQGHASPGQYRGLQTRRKAWGRLAVDIRSVCGRHFTHSCANTMVGAIRSGERKGVPMRVRRLTLVAFAFALASCTSPQDGFDAAYNAHATRYSSELTTAVRDYESGRITDADMQARLRAASETLMASDASTAREEQRATATTAPPASSAQAVATPQASQPTATSAAAADDDNSCLFISCPKSPAPPSATFAAPSQAPPPAAPAPAPAPTPSAGDDNSCLFISCPKALPSSPVPAAAPTAASAPSAASNPPPAQAAPPPPAPAADDDNSCLFISCPKAMPPPNNSGP